MLGTIIGSGIIAMPYATRLVDSLAIAFANNLFCLSLMMVGAIILLRVRTNMTTLYDIHEMTDRSLSISDLCFILLGRRSILLMNGLVGIALFWINILYF